ncbi:MAG: hypothetical protein DSM106950_34325 [Stigonema ocellatum SAG 48.90 = DSM 106950]|nr:hypothetical protein [Stigonema ocellatum SAG 48.90 = DSM 106950]
MTNPKGLTFSQGETLRERAFSQGETLRERGLKILLNHEDAKNTKKILVFRLASSSGRAGGQCPPYEMISFLGFYFRNKVMVQDMILPTFMTDGKKQLRQHGGNKATIPNQRKAYAVFILTFECVTFDERLAVLPS